MWAPPFVSSIAQSSAIRIGTCRHGLRRRHDTGKGNRPSFAGAARPELAERLVERLAASLGAAGIPVATGRFGALMEVALVNDGPVTIVLDG